MAKLPDDGGIGWVEMMLIIILAIMVLVTIFFLLRPAFSNLWQEFLLSIQ
jgi:hypothetical protein